MIVPKITLRGGSMNIGMTGTGGTIDVTCDRKATLNVTGEFHTNLTIDNE